MAKFELKFLDYGDDSWIEVKVVNGLISFFSSNEDEINPSTVCVQLDKSTAIKFAKTLRTEINKITESEVKNG